MKMNRKILRTGKVTITALAVMTGSALHAHEVPGGYVVNAISNAAAGSAVMAGDYTQAIEAIETESRSSVQRFFAANNLCVAHMKVAAVDTASRYCDIAVAEMENELRSLSGNRKRTPNAQMYRRYMAIALSNRGVLLAVTRQYEQARADFARAVALRARLSAVSANLARLDWDTTPIA